MSASTHDTISVIVPIYNVEKYLDQALTSIESQTHTPLEIICVNDGSTDNSLAIIQEHAARDSRYVVADRKNSGYGSGCNYGIDVASGTWIAIVEPDDWILPDMYQSMLAFAATFDDEIDIIKTPYTRIWLPDTPQEKHYECSYRRRVRPAQQPFTIACAPHLIRHHPSIWSALYRKDFLTENNIRFHEIPGAGWADNPFLLDTLLRAKSMVYLDTPYYCYRETPPEKEAAMFARTPALPFDRWQDMTDILEELHVTDAQLIGMHIEKGFMYRDSVLENNDPDRPDILALEAAMFARMEPEAVFANRSISPAKKARFAEVRGIPCPKLSSGAYYRAMFGEVMYNLRNNGFGYTKSIVSRALGRMGT